MLHDGVSHCDLTVAADRNLTIPADTHDRCCVNHHFVHLAADRIR